MTEALERAFAAIVPDGIACSLRTERSVSEYLSVRRGVASPPRRSTNVGAMVTVEHSGAQGYAATVAIAGLVAFIVLIGTTSCITGAGHL